MLWIKELIAEVGKRELATQLGVSKQTLDNWKSGRHKVSLRRAMYIATAYGVPFEKIRPDLVELMRRDGGVGL